MALEDLIIKRYTALKEEGRMVALLDENGHYKAVRATDVEKALKDGSQEDDVWVITGRKSERWTKLPKVN